MIQREATAGARSELAKIRRVLGSKPHLVDCSYGLRHRAHHHPHPETGRLVCHVCHPPAKATGG